MFVFRGRRGDIVKLLWWDGDGLCLFAKRLERGRFIWPKAEGRNSSAQPRTAFDASGRHRLAQSRAHLDAGDRGMMTMLILLYSCGFSRSLMVLFDGILRPWIALHCRIWTSLDREALMALVRAQQEQQAEDARGA